MREDQKPLAMRGTWVDECAVCANLRQSYGGRIWRCAVLRETARPSGLRYLATIGPRMVCADARAPGGPCGPRAAHFIPIPSTTGDTP